MIDYTKSMHYQIGELRSKIQQMDTEHGVLKSFARAVIQAMWDDGDVDGGDIQTLAAKYGLIVGTVATEADAKTWDHVTPGDPFFRFADWLKEAAPAPEPTLVDNTPARGVVIKPGVGMIVGRCELCQHSDHMHTKGKVFCTVNPEHYEIVDATYCCGKFERAVSKTEGGEE